MNDNQNKTSFGKSLYIFFPLIVYLAVKFIIAIVFEGVIIYKLLQQDPNMEMTAITNKVMEYIVAANSKLTIVISVFIILIGAVLFFGKEYKEFDRKYKNKIGLKGFAGAICLSIGFYMMIQIFFIIAVSVFDLTDIINEYTTNMNAYFGGDFIIDIVSLGILAPICEELIFRGLIFNRMRNIMKESNAIVFSALIFAFMHSDGIQIFYAFTLGLILAYSYSKYENIIVPVIIHMFFNLMNFAYVLGINNPTTVIGSLIFYVLCFLLTYAGVRIMLKKSKPSLKL